MSLSTLPVKARIAALLWLCVHGLIALYLYTAGIPLKSDIFELLHEKQGENATALSLGADMLSQQSGTIRFALTGKSLEATEQAASRTEAALKEIPLLSVLTPPDPQAQLNVFLNYLRKNPKSTIDPSQTAVLEAGVESLVASLQEKLYSPLSGMYTRFLETDPLLFTAQRFLSLSQSEILHQHGSFLFKVQEDGLVHASLIAQVRKPPKNAETLAQLVNSLDKTAEEVRKEETQVELRWSGPPAFALSSAKRLKQDIQLVSALGTAIAICLFLFSFRSPAPILLASLSLASGVLFGVFATRAVLGGIHLITLGIGSSLMGACIDYSVHYLCENYFGAAGNPQAVRKRLMRPVLLGALTSILAFLALRFSSFPGLQELSLFALGSIASSSCSVLLWFPILCPRKSLNPPPWSMLLHTGLSAVARIPKPLLLLLFLSMLSVLFWGFTALRFDDDIRSLQTPDSTLLQNEIWVRAHSVYPSPEAYVISSADSIDAAFERLYSVHQLLNRLKETGVIHSFQSLYGLIPPKSVQLSNNELFSSFLADNRDALREALQGIGYSDESISSVFSSPERETLSMQEALSALPAQFAAKLKPQRNEAGQYLGVIPVYGVNHSSVLQKALLNQAQTYYFEPARTISDSFQSFRQEATLLVFFAYLLILGFLLKRYGMRGAGFALLPLLASTVGTLGLLGLFSEAISFFTVFGLLLALGLSVDFSIFLLESGRDTAGESASVQTAIIISALSSISTFGLLSLSDTAVLHTLGLSVSLGVSISALCSLALSSMAPSRNASAGQAQDEV